MDCQTVQNYFLEYLSGELPESLRQEIELHLQKDDACRENFEQMRNTWEEMGKAPLQKPSPALALNFQQLLEQEQALQDAQKIKPKVRSLIWQRIGAVAAGFLLLLISSWLFWKISLENNDKAVQASENQIALSQEKQVEESPTQTTENLEKDVQEDIAEQKNEQLPTNTEKTSVQGEIIYAPQKKMPSAKPIKIADDAEEMIFSSPKTSQTQPTPDIRIQNIYQQLKQLNTINQTLIDQWAYALAYDSNANVRLSAVDALSAFGQNPLVQQHIINTLNQQNEPLVQIALLDFMMQYQVKNGKTAIEQLLLKTDLHETVRIYAQMALTQIS